MKTALVTGSNRGLGRGFVEYLVSQEFHVFAGMRNTNVNDTLFKNKHVTVISLDVSQDQSIHQAFQLISKQTKHLDLLINNAGTNKQTATNNQPEQVCSLDQLNRQSLLNMFNVNAVSPLMMVKLFLPMLTTDPSLVINISSDRASFHDHIPNSSANYGYRSSKIALNMMTFSSMKDLPKNMRICAMHPGSVLTNMNPQGTSTPLEQAKKIVELTNNWRVEFNGKFLTADGEFYPL